MDLVTGWRTPQQHPDGYEQPWQLETQQEKSVLRPSLSRLKATYQVGARSQLELERGASSGRLTASARSTPHSSAARTAANIAAVDTSRWNAIVDK